MGQTTCKAQRLSPQSSRTASQHRCKRDFPSIVTVLDSKDEWSASAPQGTHAGKSRTLEDRSTLFDRSDISLLPLQSSESEFSASSITENFTLREPSVDPRSKGLSPSLLLPIEILYKIIEIVYYDHTTNSISANLERFLKTLPILLKTFNQLAIRFLYKYAIFNRPHSFDKFLRNIANQPDIGQYVEFMDFQTFTLIGLGRTGRMNQEIQMVTSSTILMALSLCPNLIEFQASENIQDDIDVAVLDALFNRLPRIQALDFCGASLKLFAEAFCQLTFTRPDPDLQNADDNEPPRTLLHHLFKISFHDCSNLPVAVFAKVLPQLVSLRRLDVTHTTITSTVLVEHLPTSCRLTHLSIARCSRLTTKDLIHFLTKHPAIANGSLQWLNLQIDSNVVSPLSDLYLLYTLNHLNAPDLRYLNLGGMPVNMQVLEVIRSKFTRLESLAVLHSSLCIADLLHLLHDNRNIKFLDLTDCKGLDRRMLHTFLKQCTESGLQALEFNYKTLYDLTDGNHIRILPLQTDFSVLSNSALPQVWRFYDNEGRRAWIYKIDPFDQSYNDIVAGRNAACAQSSSAVYYDLETGLKVETKVSKPAFLKYASRKINCSIGYNNLNVLKKKRFLTGELAELVWPVESSQRGIYNYYSLNVK